MFFLLLIKEAGNVWRERLPWGPPDEGVGGASVLGGAVALICFRCFA